MSYVGGALSPWQLTAGSAAPGPGQLVIDKGSADKGHFSIGDTVTVLTQTGSQQFSLVGIARFGTADSPGGASRRDLRPGRPRSRFCWAAPVRSTRSWSTPRPGSPRTS